MWVSDQIYTSNMSKWLSVTCNFVSIFYKKMGNVSSCEYDRWVVLCGHQTTGLQPNPTPTKPNATQQKQCVSMSVCSGAPTQPNSNPTRAVAPQPNPTQPNPQKTQDTSLQ